MKHVLSLICCMLMVSNITYGDILPKSVQMVNLYAQAAGPIISGSSAGNTPFPRTPIATPTVYLDGSTLLFYTEFEDDIEVQLLDPDTMGDDEPTVVYSTTLMAGDNELTLPSTYSGEYGIRLVVGNWYFIGYIEL